MRHLRSDYDVVQDVAQVLDSGATAPTGESTSIAEDEPVFLLRAKDPAAPDAVRAWADEAQSRGSDLALCDRVREWADQMDDWRLTYHPEKQFPDSPEGVLR